MRRRVVGKPARRAKYQHDAQASELSVSSPNLSHARCFHRLTRLRVVLVLLAGLEAVQRFQPAR